MKSCVIPVMRPRVIRVGLLALALVLAASPAHAERGRPRRPATSSQTPAAPKAAPKPPPREAKPVLVREEMDPDTRFYPTKLNTFLGIYLVRSSAFAIGAQYGVAVDDNTPLYVGPEFSFAIFSPGNVLMTLASAWYDMRIFGSPRLGISVGALAGAAFPSGMVGYRGMTYAAFLDATISQDIDDLVAVRGQLRPGTLGGVFAFMMNLNISFRFL